MSYLEASSFLCKRDYILVQLHSSQVEISYVESVPNHNNFNVYKFLLRLRSYFIQFTDEADFDYK